MVTRGYNIEKEARSYYYSSTVAPWWLSLPKSTSVFIGQAGASRVHSLFVLLLLDVAEETTEWNLCHGQEISGKYTFGGKKVPFHETYS